jgi:hypothetical protein
MRAFQLIITSSVQLGDAEDTHNRCLDLLNAKLGRIEHAVVALCVGKWEQQLFDPPYTPE